MIGGLQGENGDLDIKYLKAKNLKMSVANIGKHSGEFRMRARWVFFFRSDLLFRHIEDIEIKCHVAKSELHEPIPAVDDCI